MKQFFSFMVCLTLACFFWKFSMPQRNNQANFGSVEKLYPAEDHFLQKQYPLASFHVRAYEKAMKKAYEHSLQAGSRTSGEWVVQGPGNIGARANTIAVNPEKPDHMLVGFSEGGLFLTLDGGRNWEPVFDDQPGLSIGDVVFDPSNPNIVYAGTGDPNVSGYPFIGHGIYKSNDGGKSWKQCGLQPTRIISQIRVSNQNSNTIYVGAMGLPFEKNTHRGVYKSTDGGLSWKQVLFVNDSTGIADLVIHPLNDNIVYATGWNRIRNNQKSVVAGPDARIYKSTDGGASWKMLEGGLPMDASSRIGIDISQSNPNVLYACYTHPSSLNLKGIYKSSDGGSTWKAANISSGDGLGENVYAGFGWYFGKIRINPKDENDVFLLAVDIYRSRDGGNSWKSAGPPWWTYEVHADKHDLIFVKNDMYLTTDGGAYKAEVITEKWEDIENIATTQFYRVAYNPHNPSFHYGGAQDNGSSGGNQSIVNAWPRIYGGDGFQMAFHPVDSFIFYVETQNGGIAVTKNGGQSYEGATFGIQAGDPRNWDMPYLLSKHNPDVLIAGTNKIYMSTSGTEVAFQAISPDLTDPTSNFLRHNISALDQSPADADALLAGTSDGLLWLTRDGGKSWQNISLSLPKKYVSSCGFSENNAIYVTYTGYKDNDNTPYIFASFDMGSTWKSIQGDLPKVAINNVLPLRSFDDIQDKNIAVATDAGVYFTSNGGNQWQRLGTNMPVLTVYDIEYNPEKNWIVAGTFGRSIQTFDMVQVGYPEPSSVNTPNNNEAEVRLVSTCLAQGASMEVCKEQNTPVFAGIADVCGRIVWQGTIADERQHITLPGLPSGVYFFTYKPNRGRKEKAIRFIIL